MIELYFKYIIVHTGMFIYHLGNVFLNSVVESVVCGAESMLHDKNKKLLFDSVILFVKGGERNAYFQEISQVCSPVLRN